MKDSADSKIREIIDTATERLFTQVYDLPDILFVKDENGKYVLVNNGFVKFFGEPVKEKVYGKTDFDFYPESVAQKIFETENEIIETREVRTGLLQYGGNKNEVLRAVEFSKYPLFGNSEEIIGILGIGKDISEQIKNEELIKETESELSLQSGRAEMATDILHNVGNIINSINISINRLHTVIKASKFNGVEKVSGLLDRNKDNIGAFLEESEKGKLVPVYLRQLSQELKKEQNELSSEVEKLHAKIILIRNILDIQQNLAIEGPVEKETFLADIINVAFRVVEEKLAKCFINFDNSVSEDLKVRVVRSKMIHVFVNLFKNSIESIVKNESHSPEIIVRAEKEQDKVICTVTDNGEGVRKEFIDKIFEHGFTTKRNGFGFGLHSCRLSVQEINGEIYARSEGLTKGMTMIIVLPSI